MNKPIEGPSADLIQEAKALEAGPAAPGALAAAPGEGAAPAAELSNAQAITGALLTVRDVFSGFTGLESPRRHFGQEQAEALGAAWGAVCDKHGWKLTEIAGGYGAELAAVSVTVPLVLTLTAAVRAELAQRKKPAEKREQEATA